MTQLILDTGGENLSLPEVKRGKYTCGETPLYTDIEMASGRLIRETRGRAYSITYQQTVFTDLNRAAFLAACEKGLREPIECMFLPPVGTELQSGTFLVTSYQGPRYQWSRPVGGKMTPVWAEYAVTLREVEPHD